MELNVIFEDNHIIVVEKPVGILTQGDKTDDIDMQNIIKKYLKEKYNKPGNVFVGIVHRLDRNVGGIMVFAKTSKAASRLSKQIREGGFKKGYIAIACGKIKKQEGTFTDYLLKNEKENKVYVVEKQVEGAKFASLSYKVIAYKEGNTEVKINLHTGRAHQIRVQFASRGHPLMGDTKYGGKKARKIFLKSYSLEFCHPTRNEILNFFIKL